MCQHTAFWMDGGILGDNMMFNLYVHFYFLMVDSCVNLR
jgi:hypothetical protein